MNSIVISRKISLAIILAVALAMIFTVIPLKASAANETVVIDIFVQDPNNPNDDAFIIAKEGLLVTAGLAGEYGYRYAPSIDSTKDVTAFDAIVAAHIEKYGSDKEIINSKLSLDGDWIATAFEGTTGFWMTYVNGSSPNDGVYGEFGFTGFPSNEARISSGDVVTLFSSKGLDPADSIAHFEMNGAKVDAITVKAGEPFDLSVIGYSSAMMFEKLDTIKSVTGPLPGAIIDTVSFISPGANFDASPVSVVTDAEGKATMLFPEAGTYMISASYDAAAPNALMAPVVTVNVTYDGVDVIKTPLLERLIVNNNPGRLSPAFDQDVNDYTYSLRDIFEYIVPEGIGRSQHINVVYSLDGKEYSRGEMIPVEDGSVIELTVSYVGIARPPVPGEAPAEAPPAEGEEPAAEGEAPASEGETPEGEAPVEGEEPVAEGEAQGEEPASEGEAPAPEAPQEEQPPAEGDEATAPADVAVEEVGPGPAMPPVETNVYTIKIKKERKVSAEFADVGIPSLEVLQADIEKIAKHQISTTPNPSFGIEGGEWVIMGLARGGKLTNSYLNKYLKNLISDLKDSDGYLTENKYTDYSRIVFALSSTAKYPTNIGGFDVLSRLAEFEKVNAQGVNGATFALLALDSKNYDMPSLPKGSDSTQATRESYIKHILDQQQDNGAFALTQEAAPDVDVTAMVIQALAPYCEQDANVEKTVDDALAWLSSVQTETGSFGNVSANAEVMVALNSMGISIDDVQFVKAGYTVYDALMQDYLPNVGAFRLTEASNAPENISTDHGMYALVSLERALTQRNTLYDMTDGFEPLEGTPMLLIYIAAALVLIVIIVLIAFNVSKKKKNEKPLSHREARKERKKREKKVKK